MNGIILLNLDTFLIRRKVLGTSMVGCDPNTMGPGPIYAIRSLLEKTKLSIDDVDIFELNEAFASQSLACMRELGLPADKVIICKNYLILLFFCSRHQFIIGNSANYNDPFNICCKCSNRFCSK